MLGDVLESSVEAKTDLRCLALPVSHPVGKNHPAKGVAQPAQLGRPAAQMVGIGPFYAGETLGINIGETEQRRGQTALRIDPPFTLVAANPGNSQAADLGRQLERGPTS